MDLNRFLIILTGLFANTIIFSADLLAQVELKKLSTKQSINNLRFISHNGKFTYFQRRSGGILLSTNYKAIEFLKGDQGSQYTIIGSPERKKLIISQDPFYHNFYGVRHNQRLFKIDYGEQNAIEIGVGVSPTLHLKDNWVSFYDTHLKSIFYKNINNDSLTFKILLGNSLNSYFIPQTLMATEELILFTDINSEGIPGVILFNRKKNSLTPFYKSSSANSKIEICQNDNSLFIGIFGLNRSYTNSTILKYDIKNIVTAKEEIIYTSNKNDYGQMVCNFDSEFLYFIKNYSTEKKDRHEVTEINIPTKAVTRISNIQYATSLINMDGLLLMPFRGEYFIVKGNSEIINDSILVNPKIPPPLDLKEIVNSDKNKEILKPKVEPTPTPAPTPTATSTATPTSPTISPELPGLK